MNIFRQKFTDHTDEALMQAIRQRDKGAFEELYDRYGSRMYRFFFRMLWQDAGKAEDFTQELFLKIIEKPHFFDPNRNFRTWIYTLASNLCKNEYRRPSPGITFETPNIWYNPAPESMDKELFEQQLQQCIEQLSPTHHQCFVLRYQEEMSVTEIAEIVGCPEGTIKSRLHYALQKVTEQMEGWKSALY